MSVLLTQPETLVEGLELLDGFEDAESEIIIERLGETLAQNVGVEDRQRVGEGVKVRPFEEE